MDPPHWKSPRVLRKHIIKGYLREGSPPVTAIFFLSSSSKSANKFASNFILFLN